MSVPTLTPFTFTRRQRTKGITDLHKHTTLEILYVINGIVILEVYTADNDGMEIITETAVFAGQFVYIAPNCKHRQRSETDGECFVLELGRVETKAQLVEFLKQGIFTKNFDRLIDILSKNTETSLFLDSANVNGTLERLISLLYNKSQNKQDNYFDTEYNLLLNDLFLKTCQCEEASNKLHWTNYHSRSAIAFIETKYSTAITVQKIATFAGISTVRLNQILKEDFNMSAWEIVQKKRLQLAEKLLNTTEYGAKKIAQKCGYTSMNSFRAAFVKQYGKSPAEYRKSCKPQFAVYSNIGTVKYE